MVAGPFAPATTPAPQLTNGTSASPGSNGSPSGASTSQLSDESTVELRSAELQELTDQLEDEPEDTASAADDRTPTDDVHMRPTDKVGDHVLASAASASVDPDSPSVKERRELPTQRLRAVTDELVEDPGPRRTPGRATPAVDADVDDDDDDELETASSVSSPAPAAGMARGASGGGLTPAATGGKQAWLAYAALGVAAAGIISVMVYKYMANPDPPAITVSAMVPSPTTVYRFWDTAAKVDRVEAPAFSFSGEGKLAEIAAPGTRYGAGDVLALLEGGKKFRTDLAHNRERLGYYEQMRDSMSQQNNKPEVRQAELKIAEKKRLIAEAQASLSRQAIIATTPGEIAETLAKVGATVKAGDPAMKAKGTGYRATFELSREDAEQARQLGFCRAEIDGKPLDCSLASEGGDETHLVVDLPSDPVVGVGKTARLARDRLDAVFSVPASALLKMGDSDRLFVVTPSNRAELRVVAVQERTGQEAIITQGLDVGDRVVVDAPADLKPEARVLIRETVAK
jgi:biotin carboxyl carrier protein